MSPFRAERAFSMVFPLFCLLVMAEINASGDDLTAAMRAATHPSQCVTNISQFAALSNVDYIVGCNFCLTGVVTLVDAKRDLVVLQDDTGAVALNFRLGTSALRVGESVTLNGTNAVPLFPNFPDFPFRPSGRSVLGKLETPSNWGEYNLTRLRGYLRPPVTGNYRFWIASDNSSELWLSTDANAWNARRIAVIPRFGWTAPRQWTAFTSQHSDLIPLKAGEIYYIEALQEQTAEAENLSVAWQAPGPGSAPISVVDGQYLSPWRVQGGGVDSNTNGVLWEFWTNYIAGDVGGMAGAHHFESALSVESVSIHSNGAGELPKPERLALDRRWRAEDNYRWVVAEGLLRFAAMDGEVAQLEVLSGRSLIQVRAPQQWSREILNKAQQLTNAFVRVEGVCEGIHDSTGAMAPGLIWASAENSLSVLYEATNELPNVETDFAPTRDSSSQALQEYFQTQGVITFNDRVFDMDLILIQGENSVTKVLVNSDTLKRQLLVGHSMELGGKLGTGKYIQSIAPFFAADLGAQMMPPPVACPPPGPAQANLEGHWSEIEGVVHSVNTNGTLSLIGKNGLGYVSVGRAEADFLAHCVDAKLRARGVLSVTLLDAPLLLVPSRSFLDVEEEAPDRPFDKPRESIAHVLTHTWDASRAHRVRIAGMVTYRDANSFFIQDTTGGIHVESTQDPMVKVGDSMEVAAFPPEGRATRDLTDPLVRLAKLDEAVTAKNFDLNDASSAQGGTLVQVSATVLVRKVNGANQILDMQEKQRIFTATLLADYGTLPEIVPGSRVRVTGIREDSTSTPLAPGEQSLKAQLPASVNILLRGPEDIQVLSGPPSWTWKEGGIVGGLLLVMLAVALLWTYLLRRRLMRQEAQQLAFSRQVLGKLEEERSRIAGNLHDSLGQTLMVIKHRVISAASSLVAEPGLQSSMLEISAVASQALDEVRRITHGLGPHQLDQLGVTRALRAIIDRASENSSIIFANRIENIDGLFKRDSEVHLYRIVQEAVTNILRHSSATEATVVVKKLPSAVSISIRDNGRGFDSARPTGQLHDFGYGLSGIAERVRILKGTLTVESQPGAGTSLAAEVPFNPSQLS